MTTALTSRSADRDDLWRTPVPPKPGTGLALLALAIALGVTAAAFRVIAAIQTVMVETKVESAVIDWALWIAGALSVLLFIPAYRAFTAARRSQAAVADKKIVEARVESAAAHNFAYITMGYAVAVVLVLGVGLFIIANDVAVGKTFIYLPLIFSSFGLVIRAFWTNVYIFCIAEVLVLVWGLLVAIARLIPGDAGRPIRLIATAYTDVFRGLPAIITIYLVGFGLPLTGLPIVRDFAPEWYAILALTLTYGAYVAEVYRSGIESIHWSQTAAARSLGLGFGQTLRFVVVPQAVRRIIPPLLNDFIGLQKDTALVNVIGAIDAFNQAKIIASNHFNLSSVTTVAFLFVIITIPQTRLVDRLIERDQRRMRASG